MCSSIAGRPKHTERQGSPHTQKDGTEKGSESPVQQRELFHNLHARVHLSGAKRLKETLLKDVNPFTSRLRSSLGFLDGA